MKETLGRNKNMRTARENFLHPTLKVRDAWHLHNLWVTKILTHSICVWLNLRLHRNPLDLDGLVEFEKA